MAIIDYVILALVVMVLAVCLVALRKIRKQLKQAQREKDAILSEELRMFGFLHRLGEVIGRDTSTKQLYKEIIEGFIKVLSADGGALYLLGENRKNLTPQYVSPDCPPLVGVPLEIKDRANSDPRAMESHLRLAKVPATEGVLGAALGSGEALLIPCVKSHAAFRDAFISYEEDVAALIAPLKYGGKDLGVIALVRRNDLVKKSGRKKGKFTPNDFEVFRSASEQSAFALGNAMINRELVEQRKLEDEVRTASEVQHVLLPSEEPRIPGYRVHGTNTPARMISGDYFDYIDMELEKASTGIVIADVTGKGVPAGLLMVMCRSVLRLIAKSIESPSEALGLLNRQIFPDVREDMFVSLAYVILQHDTGNLILSRAGHDAPLMYRAKTKSVETIKPPGLAIGIDEGDVFERVTRDLELQMELGDCLLFYTDGICEAIDSEEIEFGKEKLKEVFLEAAPKGAKATVEAVQKEVFAFAGDTPQMDDITLIVIEKR